MRAYIPSEVIHASDERTIRAYIPSEVIHLLFLVVWV
jgi:hypothetical protein